MLTERANQLHAYVDGRLRGRVNNGRKVEDYRKLRKENPGREAENPKEASLRSIHQKKKKKENV